MTIYLTIRDERGDLVADEDHDLIYERPFESHTLALSALVGYLGDRIIEQGEGGSIEWEIR